MRRTRRRVLRKRSRLDTTMLTQLRYDMIHRDYIRSLRTLQQWNTGKEQFNRTTLSKLHEHDTNKKQDLLEPWNQGQEKLRDEEFFSAFFSLGFLQGWLLSPKTGVKSSTQSWHRQSHELARIHHFFLHIEGLIIWICIGRSSQILA